jgi:predicted Zn-dependent protease
LALVGVLAALAAGAARAEDQVVAWDAAAKKEVDYRGTIDLESPAGLRIKTKAGIKDLPATEIRAVLYQSKAVTVLEFRAPRGKELRALQASDRKARLAQLGEALEAYKELDAQVKGEANAHRYLQYKIAQVQALMARDEPARRDAAVAALTAYKTSFPSGWEVVPCLQLLAQVLEEKGDVEGAGQAYADLAEVPGLPQDLKQQADMLAIRLLLRSGKNAEAGKRLQRLQRDLAPGDPQRAFVGVCLVQTEMARGNLEAAEAQLKAALKGATDPATRAIAYNLLGDYYRLKGQLEAAFWSYLRVDVLYNQDRHEHAKALFHLATLFDKVKNDPVRASECLSRLKAEEFTGTSYQRQAKEEKK